MILDKSFNFFEHRFSQLTILHSGCFSNLQYYFLLIRLVGEKNGKTKQVRKVEEYFRMQVSGCLGLGLGAGIDRKEETGVLKVLTFD